jgi:hypothetical protein
VIDRRRLLLAALLVVAPAIAACSNITAPGDPTPTKAAADSLARHDETKPWG